MCPLARAVLHMWGSPSGGPGPAKAGPHITTAPHIMREDPHLPARLEPGERIRRTGRRRDEASGRQAGASPYGLTAIACFRMAAASGNSFFALAKNTPSATLRAVQPSAVLVSSRAPCSTR